ncbi:MAG: hypothetical protein ACRETP_02835 [Steroidobacteraceae bacterium]
MRAISLALAISILVGAFVARAEPQTATPTGEQKRTEVVFVCEHGSVKSLVAMQHFNRMAKERGLPYRAIARGMAPERTVPVAVRAGLSADGFEMSDFLPQRLMASDVDHAALVVSFDQDITAIVAGRARHLAWNNLPAVLTDYPRGRDAIVARINALLDELAHGNPP